MARHMISTCQGEQSADTSSGPKAAWADALFASSLQCSDEPSAGQVRQAIAAAIYAYCGQGCTERVAEEFGGHPETAVMRMRWARAVASRVFSSAPTQNTPQRQPGLLANRPRTWRLAG
jgi:hypothetical protein